MVAKGYVGGYGVGRGLLLAFSTAFLAALLGIGASASPAFALSPSVETQAASSIGGTSATLNGLVNPNGLETKIYFEYGTTTSYGSKTTEVSVGSGSSTLEKSQTIESLSKETQYHYRIVASNSSGTSYGADRVFSTLAPPLAVTASAETFASGEEANLKGLIGPKGQATTYQFEYGTTSGSYTTKVPASPGSAGSGTGVTFVSSKATGLSPGTKYFYRVVATNSAGESTGSEVSFFSSKVPRTEILPASGLWRSEATLSAKIEPNASNTSYYFEYFPPKSPAVKTPTKEISGEVGSATVTEPISGLSQSTEYPYRVVATNSNGTGSSSKLSLVTLGPISLNALGGGELEESAALVASSSNLTIGGRPCKEASLIGEVDEQPGARATIASLEMQSSPLGCTWKETIWTVKYRAATQEEPHALEFAKSNSGEVLLRTGPEFRVIGEVLKNGFKYFECEYLFALSASSSTGSALEPTLSGKTDLVKGSYLLCPVGGETVSGTFAFSSEGEPVEAE